MVRSTEINSRLFIQNNKVQSSNTISNDILKLIDDYDDQRINSLAPVACTVLYRFVVECSNQLYERAFQLPLGCTLLLLQVELDHFQLLKVVFSFKLKTFHRKLQFANENIVIRKC